MSIYPFLMSICTMLIDKLCVKAYLYNSVYFTENYYIHKELLNEYCYN